MSVWEVFFDNFMVVNIVEVVFFTTAIPQVLLSNMVVVSKTTEFVIGAAKCLRKPICRSAEKEEYRCSNLVLD